MTATVTLARAFERESHRIDQAIWDALALRAGESVLFCGFANNLQWIKRAAAIGANVSVISDDAAALDEYRDLPLKALRGSTSMLPVSDETFDSTIAFHYLHEVDPLFHAGIVAELARAGKRCAIVEPAPPSDSLGLRIAALYSRAKRQLGQFENYHHSDYWKKLVSIAKRDVVAQTFSFTRTPPPHAVRDTVALIIATMAAEETPESYLAELRALAARSDAQLVPQARHVIIGTSLGLPLPARAGTDFRLMPMQDVRIAKLKAFVPPGVVRNEAPPAKRGQNDPRHIAAIYGADDEPEFPELPSAGAAFGSASTVPGLPIARNAFGLPPQPAADRALSTRSDDGSQIALDVEGSADPPAETPEDFGWSWEPPGSDG